MGEVITGIPERASMQILSLLKEVEPSEIVLFGSRALLTHREGSDIDIALKGKHLTLEDRARINVRYPSLNLPWKLDVVLYDLILEPKLREHIDKVGRRL